MAIKSSLLILSIFIAAQADLINLTVRVAITSVREVDQTSSAVTGIVNETTTNELEVNGRMAGDILQATFVIDTDFAGIQVVPGFSAAYSSSAMHNSYLPLSINASGFPEIHDLYLSGEHSLEIRNAKEYFSTRNPDFNNISVSYAIGNISADEMEIYFVNLSIPSGIGTITEGQNVTFVEGYETRHISPEGILTSHLETMESRLAAIVSFSRTTNVPEPSTISLLLVGLLYCAFFVRKKRSQVM